MTAPDTTLDLSAFPALRRNIGGVFEDAPLSDTQFAQALRNRFAALLVQNTNSVAGALSALVHWPTGDVDPTAPRVIAFVNGITSGTLIVRPAA